MSSGEILCLSMRQRNALFNTLLYISVVLDFLAFNFSSSVSHLYHFCYCFSFISVAHIISIPLSPTLLLSVSISLFQLLSLSVSFFHSYSLPTSIISLSLPPPYLSFSLPNSLPLNFSPTHPHLIQVPSYSMYMRYSGCHRQPIRPPGNASSLQPLM